MSELVRKVVTYGCGCVRGCVGVSGRAPRPPYECPDHEKEMVKGETFDLTTSELAEYVAMVGPPR